MSSIKIAYNSTTTSAAITVTLASLANGSARESTAIDNTSNLFVDALVRVKANGQSSGTATLDVYAYGAAEGSSPIYTDGATGTNAAFTAANILNAKLIGQVVMNASTGVVGGLYSVGAAFGGMLPPKWGLIFKNASGATLSTTAGDFEVVYQGVYATSA